MAPKEKRISTLEIILEELASFFPELAQSTSTPLYGGDISSVWKISSAEKPFCLKVNADQSLSGLFEAEANGLEILRKLSPFIVPNVLQNGQIQGHSFILMDYLETGIENGPFWQLFGAKLAEMHRQTARYFGLDHSNFIGSLRQENNFHENWTDFYTEERLLPQAQKARDAGLFSRENVRALEMLCGKLPSLMPKEPPALLHGDLWSGNYLCTHSLQPALIDPAVYFGHREMDFAMTRLFGSFPETFYEAYENDFPLEVDSDQRMPLFQLYPLLVHLNLFGNSYLKAVNSVTERYR